MMGRSMLQRLRQISISSSLRGAFLMGALLTLIVSSVSLYSCVFYPVVIGILLSALATLQSI